MSSFDKELEEELKKLKKKKNQTYSDALSSQNDLLSNGIYSYLPSSDDDIAPVKRSTGGGSFGKDSTKDDGGLDFFDAGSFSDGVDWHDFLTAPLATVADAGVGVAKGVMRMGEGLVDLAGYAAAGTARLFGNDEIADAWQYAAEKNATEEIFGGADKFLDKYSALGRTSNAVTEGIGQVATIIATGGAAGAAGLGSAGVTALTTGVMGLSGMGSGMSEAYEGGATDGEAVTYGAISGAADALTELIFGGMGKAFNAVGFSKGLSSMDDVLAQKVSGLFKKQITKNLAEFGIKAGAEGFEEVLAGLVQGTAKMIYSEKNWGELLADENLLEQFVVGAVTSGLSQSGVVPGMKSGSLKESIENKTDFITGLTQNEQAVIDKEFQNRLAEEEKKGKVTGKDKNKIYDEVMRDMEKGYISIETIEEVLGDRSEYDALQKESDEFKTLYETESGKLSKKQQDRLAELEAKNKANPYEIALKTAKGKFSQGVFDLVKDSRLSESYREEARKGEDFQYDLTKFKGAKHQDAVQKTLENAVKAGANNTNRVHDLVDMNAKLSGDTGIIFEYKTSEQIKNDFIERQTKKINEIENIPEAQRTEEQITFLKDMKDTLAKVESGELVVDGDITSDRIVLNLDSPKPLQRTVGHEITHSFEPQKGGKPSQEYTALRDALFTYAKDKGMDIDKRIAELKNKYQGITDANPEAELVADLVGDYLFTDNDFINNLSTKHRNVFEKIYDEIKHLLKLVRAGSKEARDLERVKKAFEDAYRKSNETSEATDTEVDDVQYSISVTDKDTVDFLNEQVAKGEYDPKTNPNGGYYVTYKSMSFWGYDENGNAILRSPMAEYVDGELSNAYLMPKDKSKLNWYQATETIDEKTGLPSGLLVGIKEEGKKSKKYVPASENQDLIAEDWSNLYFMLNKKVFDKRTGKWKNSPVPARYNPYEHSSNSMLNDQFKAAWQRDNLVTVKMYVPVSEDNGAYRAKWSKDPTGWSDWKSGDVATKINKQKDLQRRVYLSRYAAPVEIVPDSEVAQAYKGYVEGTDVAIPDNVVSPGLLTELKKAGVPIVESGNVKYSLSDSTGKQLTQEQADYFKDSKVRDENGNLKVMYHGSPAQFTVFDKNKAKSSGQYGKGFYFTDSTSHAGTYGNLYSVYLNIRNPLQSGGATVSRDQVRSYLEAVAENEDYSIENYGTYDIDAVLNNVMGKAKSVDAFKVINDINATAIGNMVEAAELFNSVNGTAFDGIVAPTETVAFYPEQIKSATDNVGTFDKSNPDIRHSISAKGEQFTPGRNDIYGSDFRVQKPMEETVSEMESVAPVAENAAVAEDLFPDELSPIYEELDRLNQKKEALESRMLKAINSEDVDTFYQVNSEYEAVMTRIAELDAEAAAEDADRLGSIEDADAPPETESYDDHVADDIPLTKTLVNGLAKEIKAKLGIPNSRTAEVRDLIQRYAKEEFPSKAHLYTEIAERFGTFTEKQIDEELKGVKSILRTHGIRVDDSIKQDIADYGQFQRSNFGKVRFSKDGLPVDVAYREFQELLPGYFPDSISVPSDQLLRIVEVANLDTTSVFEQEIDSQTLEEATDAIMKAVGEFRQKRRETFAEQQGREAFKSMMESADQNVPPVRLPNIPVTRAEMKAQPGDIAPVFDTSSGQQAFMPEEEVPKKVTRGELHESIVDKIKTTFREKGFDFDEVLKKAKDLSTFATVDNTPQRVMEKALGYKQGQVLSDLTVNQVAQNETEGIKWLNSFTDKKSGLLAKISKQYGIKPGSKESAAAQMYAEGFYVGENDAIIAYGDSELAKDFPNAKVQENIKKLARDPRIRQIYDETLEAINASRTRNAYPEIPRLENYFLHFRAMEDTFSRLGLPFNPNDIRAKDLPTDLNGVTADLKPGQPYFASAMHRKGKRTSFDLLGGLEKYLSSAKNQIYHIDDIQTLRALRNYVAETYGQAHGLENLDTMSDEEAEQRIKEVYNSHLSTFAKFLNEEANILAGKTSLIDRGLEGIIGRRGITTLDTINRQVGANMVGFNVSSSLTNLLAPIQAFAKTNKFDFVKAMAQTASNKIGSLIGKGDTFAEDSPVMIRRKGAERFYRTPWEKAGDVGYLMMGVVDDISTELIARTKYNELTRKGMDSQQAHYETDKWVSRLMGDRSLGQQPQLYNSKMLGLFTKFQLEVRNQLDSQFYDTIQEAKASTEDIENGLLRNAKKAAKITSTFVQLAVVQHLFGKAFESIAGYNPSFDIIEALIKTFGWDDEEDDEDTVLDNIEQGFLELLGDLPYTSTLTGGRIPIESALPVTELIKGEDKYGNEKSRWETLGEIAPYYLLPGGYGQIKKTVQGLNMFDEEHPIAGSYTDKGDLRFPVEDTLSNRVQAGLFGQWASGNAQDYFDGERKPLNEKQIQEFIDVGLTIQDYWKYRDGLKGLETLAEKADYIDSLDLTDEQKNILINNIADRKEDIDMSEYGNYGSFEEFDYASKNPEKYSFLKDNNVSYSQYKNFDEDTKNAYDWAFENPEKSTLVKAVTGDVVSYRKYAKDLNDIRADKDANGKTINGSAKEKKVAYINSLDIDYGQKIILYKSLYEADDTYNYEIVEYLNGRGDISYGEMVTILTELGFKVSSDGNVTWD